MNCKLLPKEFLMNFGELVAEFKSRTGFQNITNARIAHFLNNGLKYLEGTQSILENIGVVSTQDWASGSTSLTLTNVKHIKMLYQRYLDTDCWSPLYWVSLGVLTMLYPKLEDSTTGTPLIWSYNAITDNDVRQSAILIMPPADKDYYIRVEYEKRFAEFTGDDNDETNDWAYSYPEVLLLSAQLSLEASLGNTERLTALRMQIAEVLNGIDNTEVSRTLQPVSSMERKTTLLIPEVAQSLQNQITIVDINDWRAAGLSDAEIISMLYGA